MFFDRVFLLAAAPALVAFACYMYWRASRKKFGIFRSRLVVAFCAALVGTASFAFATLIVDGHQYPSNLFQGMFIFLNFLVAFFVAIAVASLCREVGMQAISEAIVSLVLPSFLFMSTPSAVILAACMVMPECI